MKNILTVLTAILVLSFSTKAQLSGPLSGILAGDSTYTVIGNIWIEEGDSLIIEAGAVLLFNAGYRFDIYGYIHAAGTESDSVKFTNRPDQNWVGLNFYSASDSCKLEYCLITGGLAGSYPNNCAGGILLDNSSPYILNCTIDENTAPYGSGGGIYCDSSSAIIIDCVISDNISDHGGGIYCNNSNPLIINCFISENSTECTAGPDGGGICSYNSSPIIINCIISENYAHEGGGIFCYNSNIILRDCDIIRNTAISGGGIFYSSQIEITNCAINGNMATFGGGIFGGGYNTVITNCAISDNNATSKGGGFYCNYLNPTITNCTICGNSTGFDEGGGAGFYITGSSCQPLITNCVISDNNTPRYGGAIYLDDGACFSLKNTIVTDNNGDCGIYFTAFTPPALTYCDFHNNQNGNFSLAFPGVGQIITTNANGDSCDQFYNILLDPLFYSTTGDSAYYLTVNSPCIDAGNPDSPLDPDSTIADIGAFYYDQTVGVENPTFHLSPFTFHLSAPYPNPFNSSTAISYQLQADSYVELVVYDMLGREVQLAVSSWQLAGKHEVVWDASNQTNGVYFVRLTVDGQSSVKKAMLIK